MLFSSPKLLVAVDIGSHSVKLANLKMGRKGYELMNFGMVSLPPDTVVDGEIGNAQALTEALRNLLKSEKIKAKEAVIGISGQSVIIKKISVPMMSEEELQEMIREEAEQYIPFDIEEVNLDFQIVKAEGEVPAEKGSAPAAEEKQMDVIIVAVRKEVVQSFLDVFKEVGMKVKVVDLAVFALQNAYEMNHEIEPDTAVALINIGAGMTNMNILEGGITAFTRDIPIGGATISENIQKNLSIGFSEAERLKLGIFSKEHTKEQVLPHVKEGVRLICNELTKTIEMYEKTSDHKVSKLVLSGGSCQMEGIDMLVHSFVGLETEILNSLKSIEYSPKRFDSEYIETMGPVAAICVGLAIRRADDK